MPRWTKLLNLLQNHANQLGNIVHVMLWIDSLIVNREINRLMTPYDVITGPMTHMILSVVA